jgi:XTP/dITP diphosphohydrolase
MELVLATANTNKVREISEILGEGFKLIPRPDGVPEPIENGESLTANARLKSRAIAEATGLPAVGDDTGFEIDALDGQPGVDGAYFAGPNATHAENCAKVIACLEHVSRASERSARYRTVALVSWPDGEELLHEATCEGTVPPAVTGDGGFGFDSVFVPDEGDGRTFAQMTREEKGRISHRRKAFGGLRQKLENRG